MSKEPFNQLRTDSGLALYNLLLFALKGNRSSFQTVCYYLKIFIINFQRRGIIRTLIHDPTKS